jgi:hypothetical protein
MSTDQCRPLVDWCRTWTIDSGNCSEETIVVDAFNGAFALTVEAYQGGKFDGKESRIVAEAEEACSAAFVEGEVCAKGGSKRVSVFILLVKEDKKRLCSGHAVGDLRQGVLQRDIKDGTQVCILPTSSSLGRRDVSTYAFLQ